MADVDDLQGVFPYRTNEREGMGMFRSFADAELAGRAQRLAKSLETAPEAAPAPVVKSLSPAQVQDPRVARAMALSAECAAAVYERETGNRVLQLTPGAERAPAPGMDPQARLAARALAASALLAESAHHVTKSLAEERAVERAEQDLFQRAARHPAPPRAEPERHDAGNFSDLQGGW